MRVDGVRGRREKMSQELLLSIYGQRHKAVSGMPLTTYWRGELLTYWQLSGELEQLIADKDEMSRTEFAWHYPRTLATVRQIAEELRRYFGRNRQGGRRINIDPDTRDLIDGFMDAEDDISSLQQRRETVKSCLHYRQDAEAEAEVYRRDLDRLDSKVLEVAARRQGIIDSLEGKVST